MEPEEEAKETIEGKKKQHITETIAAFAILVISLSAIGFGAWYYLGNQSEGSYLNQRVFKKITGENSDTIITTTPKDETSGWKTYVSSVYKYSVKYPSEWFVKEYGSGIRTEANPTCFVKTQVEFPPAQSDAPCSIKIFQSNDLDLDNSAGITRETVTIAGKSVTKMTIPANIPKRFGGWPETLYIFPYNSSYLYFQVINNYELDSFDKIVKSVSFY